MAVDRHQVENFLYREARLMDEHAYDEWLALWTEDVLYWVPSNDDDMDPNQQVAIIYYNLAQMHDRIGRLKGGAAYSQDPQSRLRRVVSNIEIEEADNGEVVVYSNFNLTELRRGKQDTFAARTIHRLRPDREGFKMVSKKVLLLNNDEVIDNLTFLI